jgi:hypothetical protein
MKVSVPRKPTICSSRIFFLQLLFHFAHSQRNSHLLNLELALFVLFATSRNMVVKSTMFPQPNTHKHTSTSPEWTTHNHTANVLIDRTRHSSVTDVRSFRGPACDTDHYLVVAKVRERLAVSKRAAQKIDTERFNLKKLTRGGGVLKNSIRLQSETCLQLWKTWRTVETSIRHGKILERKSKFRPKRV